MVSFRIWVLIAFLLFSFAAIAPWNAFENGVVIKSIEKNSTEYESGLRAGMIIKSVNSQAIANLEGYNNLIQKILLNKQQQKIVIKTESAEYIFLKEGNLGIIAGDIPSSKIKTGLDLSGGARALIKPSNVSLTSSEINDLVAITSERFNVYGLKDITIKPVKDLQGNNYLLIEIAGATPADLEEMVSKQGKFEAKIGNQTVFIGGKDIAHVERSGQSAVIEGCYPSAEGGEFCRFRFPISLTEDAAKRHAEITANLSLSSENPEYLSEKLDLYVDDILTDSLFISKDLKGQLTTQISVQGSGTGSSRQEALDSAGANMKKLQIILITGSLPYKLEIVKLDTISPNLGKEFSKNLLILAAVIFVLISVSLFIKYRKIKITLAVILTMFSEAFITLGIAALINWNLDAPSIAGIIAGMGTGVNDQIVIIDESNFEKTTSIKERIKKAFFIILAAFFTIVVAMIPLFWAGAGMLKGFALTTIISVCVGILVTRPAFADIIKKLIE